MWTLWWIHCYQRTSRRELNAVWISRGFHSEKAASCQMLLLLIIIPHSGFCSSHLCTPWLILPPPRYPTSGLWKIFTVTLHLWTFSPSRRLSSFLVSLSIIPHLHVSCHICVFPFSVCHHKLPVISVSPPQCHSFVLLLTCPSRPPTFLHERQAFRHPAECACCNSEVYLVTASFHRSLHTRTHPFIVQYSQITTHCLLRSTFCFCCSLFRESQSFGENTHNKFTFLWPHIRIYFNLCCWHMRMSPQAWTYCAELSADYNFTFNLCVT